MKQDLTAFITATGGTITTCGNFKIHTFTGPGTFTVSVGNAAGSNTVDYLVGGAGGGGGYLVEVVVEQEDLENLQDASGCYTASPLGACVQLYQLQSQVIQLQ